MLTTLPTNTNEAQLLRPYLGNSADEFLAAALVRIALDKDADVRLELDCAAFVAELDAEAESGVTT